MCVSGIIHLVANSMTHIASSKNQSVITTHGHRPIPSIPRFSTGSISGELDKADSNLAR